LLALRPPVRACGGGERLVQVVHVPPEIWKRYDARAVSQQRRQSQGPAGRLLMECVPVDVDILSQRKSGLQPIEALTGAQVCEHFGLKRCYIEVSGARCAVEKALPMVEALMAVAPATSSVPTDAADAVYDSKLQPQLSQQAEAVPKHEHTVGRSESTESCVQASVIVTPPPGLAFLSSGMLLEPHNSTPECRPSGACVPDAAQAPAPPKPRVSWAVSTAFPEPSKHSDSVTPTPLLSQLSTAPVAQVTDKRQMQRPPAPPIPDWERVQAATATGAPVAKESSQVASAQKPSPHPALEWSCPRCTLLNSQVSLKCDACDGQRPDVSTHSSGPKRRIAATDRPSSSTAKARPGAPSKGSSKIEEAQHPLPQRTAPTRPPLKMFSRGLVVEHNCRNAASSARWAERPVERLSSGTAAQTWEEEDPELACYIWDRRSERPKLDRRQVFSWGRVF